MHEHLASAHRDIFAGAADDATYTPKNGDPVTVKAVRDDGVAMLGEYGQVAEVRTTITALREDVGQPVRGDVFELRGTFVVDSIVEDESDEYVVSCSVRSQN